MPTEDRTSRVPHGGVAHATVGQLSRIGAGTTRGAFEGDPAGIRTRAHRARAAAYRRIRAGCRDHHPRGGSFTYASISAERALQGLRARARDHPRAPG
ncbi:hypothetical protein [Streptomyces sp. NPDC002540]